MKKIGRLHVITDTIIQSRFTHAELAKMAIEGGADTIQFRQKDGSTRELVESAQAVQAVCAERWVPLIVNDRADIALAAGAAGAHFGQDDLPITVGRKILPPEMTIGASARTEERILEAISAGADCAGGTGCLCGACLLDCHRRLGFGPIYQTSSKANAEMPKGLDALRRMSEIAQCPVIAIGGITVETAYEVIRAGAHGIAVISAVCGQADPAAATRHLCGEIRRAKVSLAV